MNNKKEGPPGNREGQKKNYTCNITDPISFVKIPAELKHLQQFVCWKYNNGKKPPINPVSGRPAATNDSGSWNTYSKTVFYYERYKDKLGIAGIGFVLTEQDGYCVIDIDNCRNRDTEELIPFAEKIVTEIDSYTEISPSGEGLHIITKAKPSFKGNRYSTDTDKVEIYYRSRYFTMTGNVLNNRDRINERQAEVDAIIGPYFSKGSVYRDESGTGTGGKQKTFLLSDDDIIQEINNRPDDNKYKLLWRGDWKKVRYPSQNKKEARYRSQSEADLALCNFIVTCVGPDPKRIDSLFRKSGLYREKWNRSDYRNNTINKAIEKRPRSFYTKRRSQQRNLKIRTCPNQDGLFTAFYQRDSLYSVASQNTVNQYLL